MRTGTVGAAVLRGMIVTLALCGLAGAAYAQGSGTVVILVEDRVEPEIRDELALHKSDLEGEGYSVVIQLVDSAANTAQNIRSILQGTSGISGAYLVGDLAIISYRNTNDFDGRTATFPCDIYYMDIDGTWSDSNSDGYLDGHSGDRGLEIWVGRIKTGNVSYIGSEIPVMKRFFEKCHEYRCGILASSERAMLYEKDDDWSSQVTGSILPAMRDAWGSADVDHLSSSYTTHLSKDYPDNYEFNHI
ncbi:MAG: C25 family cysteine peptidase, partial [Planctomycetota bacterium]